MAATVGKLWGFDAAVLANAMGAAYAHYAGNIQSTSDSTRDVWLNAGMGARAGLTAAELAERGHRGATAPLLGGSGLYPLYCRGEYHEEALLSHLGVDFESGYVSIKPYPSCKCTHHAIYTTLALMQRHQLRAEDIERIVVRTCQYNMRLVVVDDHGAFKPLPRTLNEAQFSMPFTIAVAAVKGAVFTEVLTDTSLDDPDVLRMFGKISIPATAEKDALQQAEGYPPDDVEIHTVDGRVYQGCERYVTGHPRNPMTFEDVAEKFWKCAAFSIRPLSHEKLDTFLSHVKTLEQVANARCLAQLLA